MHILIAVLHRPTHPTGVCRHAANLAQCLVNLPEITQVTLITGAWQQHYFAADFALSSPKIKILGVDIQNRSSTRNLWFLFGLPQLVKQLNPDLVHLAFPLPFLRSRFPCPVVATIHDLYPYECPENFGRVQSIFNRLFLRQCLAQSDGLTCVSQETLKQLKFFFPEAGRHKEVTVTYNSVDFSEITPQCPEIFRQRAATPFLLTVAQHRKNKNLDLLIQAFANLRQDQQISPSTELILVGSSGPETPQLQQQIAALQLQSRVHLLSSLQDPELCWLYQNCQVYVVSSSTEGFCLPLAEALSLGCKVVCSDIPILREVALSDCTYFNLASKPVAHLAEAIVETMAQPHSRSNQGTRFSRTTIAQQYLDFYRQVIA
jgi:glycosyltransferase involved in cell wall biosynthesis